MQNTVFLIFLRLIARIASSDFSHTYLARNLAYLRYVNSDVIGAFEGVTRCVQVILRYPGLCRYTTW